MKLTHQEKQAILAGNLKKLARDTKPGCESGDEFTVAVSRPRPHVDPETKHVFRTPSERSAWITVTNVVRRAKGGWAIHFNLTDNRHTTYYLAKGGGYTTDHKAAIDKLQVDVDAATQARITAEARQANADRRARDAELAEREARRQERVARNTIHQTLRGLSPTAQAVLLANIERVCREMGDLDDKAA